jgi:elongation factor 1-alpha
MSETNKADPNKKHVSVVIAGHVDSGKSTTTGHLLFKLGGISDREMQKLKDEAKVLGKESFAFAFYMDMTKQERERGITIQCTTKEFFTAKYHYTIVDAPGHRDFIKNMISGAACADTAVLMVPAEGGFTTAIAKGDHKANEVMGQTRMHSTFLNLLGIGQLIICINKMDSDTAKYSKERYEEIRDEVKLMLKQTGWNPKTIETIPILPISGWCGDNLIEKSVNMKWWTGLDVKVEGKDCHLDTLYDALDKYVQLPKREDTAPLRIPVSGNYQIKGVGTVITGRVEQGTLKPGDEVVFLPTHTAANECKGRVFSIEMHHKSLPQAYSGDNVGINMKGLPKDNMPTSGNVIVLATDTSLKVATKFSATVQVLTHPGELKVGYTPIVYVRTDHSSCKMSKLIWKMGKETGGQKVEDPLMLKAGEVAEVEWTPQQPLVVDTFKNCPGLGRVAIMDGNSVVMIGKVTKVE